MPLAGTGGSEPEAQLVTFNHSDASISGQVAFMDASLTCSVRAGGQANRDETQQRPLGLHNLHPSWVVHSAELFCAPRTPNAFWGALEISHLTNALQCELRSPGHAHCVTSSLGPQVFLPSYLLTLPPSPPHHCR